MLNFKSITLADIGIIRSYLNYSTNRTCDNTVGGMFMWREFFSMEYAQHNDTLIVKLNIRQDGFTTAFPLPLGKDITGAVRAIEEYCRSAGLPIVYCLITEDELPFLSSVYNNIELHSSPDFSDYIYKASDIASLAGRKYHGQRNHINYFNRTYSNSSFEEISMSNIGEVRKYYDALSTETFKDSDFFIEEKKRTLEVLDNYDTYGLIGGLIRIGSAAAAFSVGELLGDTLFVHIEKTDSKFRGVQQVLCNEFAKHFAADGIEFINRCEDVGDEGLRISKQSYHPCCLIDKYIVSVV